MIRRPRAGEIESEATAATPRHDLGQRPLKLLEARRIDKKGNVVFAYDNLDASDHVNQTLTAVKALNGKK